MNRQRRILTQALIGAGVLPAPWAFAQYGNPAKPMRVVVPYAAGGAVDSMARLVVERVRPRWEQGAVVDNRGGANSIIGTEFVLAQPKDGSTLLVTNSITFIVPYVSDRPGFQPEKDLVAVAEISVDHLVVYVRADSSQTTLEQVVDQERREPKSMNFGSYGTGTNGHLLLVALNEQFSMNMMHVPYKTNAQLANAVLAGEVQVGVAPYAFIKPFFDAGRLKPIAAFGEARIAALPDTPTLKESGVNGFEFTGWTGVFAARGTPQPILERLADDFRAGLSTPEFREALTSRGTDPGQRLLDDFERIVQRDARLLGEKNVAAGIRLG